MPPAPTANGDIDAQAPQWFLQALAHPGSSAHVTANGVRLHYLTWNPDDSSKPVLLLVHGFRSHAHWWDWTAPYLAEGYRIVAPDLSGMGDSERRGAYVPDTWAQDLIGFLDALGLQAVVAVGHSYGGSTLLRACRGRPDLFSRLILLDTTMTFADEAATPPPPPLPTANTCYPDLETAAARFILRPRQPEALPFLLRHIARHSARQDPDGWRWKFDPAAYPFDRYRYDGEDLLAGCPRPVDYVRAQCSGTTSPARASILAQAMERVRGGRMIEIPAAHHHMMIDQPIAVITALRTLLA
ncbi:MAG: alpha/beta hydrolase [Rhodocyclaceae bacterium]|jgi:pimeloyl-ACP methyl ester carboxylesterase|nr:alpha/beta hydrolase [Rhodocyclaceae bacterium]